MKFLFALWFLSIDANALWFNIGSVPKPGGKQIYAHVFCDLDNRIHCFPKRSIDHFSPQPPPCGRHLAAVAIGRCEASAQAYRRGSVSFRGGRVRCCAIINPLEFGNCFGVALRGSFLEQRASIGEVVGHATAAEVSHPKFVLSTGLASFSALALPSYNLGFVVCGGFLPPDCGGLIVGNLRHLIALGDLLKRRFSRACSRGVNL